MPQGGRYILCDRCNVTTFSLNLPWPQDGKTVSAAREAGWRCVREPEVNFEEDVCPSCVNLEELRPVGKPIVVEGPAVGPLEFMKAMENIASVVIVDVRTKWR